MSNKLFEYIISGLSLSDDYHVPGSQEYRAFEALADSYRKVFEEDGIVNLFGKETIIKNIKMGNISTKDLFVVHEFVLFQKYSSLAKNYKNFIDIGANIGVHSLIAHNLGYAVTAYEPDPITFEWLKSSIEKNSCDIDLKNSAVDKIGGQQKFTRVKGNLTASGLNTSTKDYYGELEEFNVDVVPVGSINLSESIIKVDAEGSEYRILSSIDYEKLSNSIFFVEVSDLKSRSALWDFFKAKDGVLLKSQKNGWKKVLQEDDLPANWREGSLSIEV